MKNIHIAHISINENAEKIQTAAEHCRSVSFISGQILKKIRLENLGMLTGLLHDMGKFTDIFDEYIKKAVRGENVMRGSVNHTFAGVIFLFERYYTPNAEETDFDVRIKNFTCEIAAYAIGAHHGLFDCIDKDGNSGFDHRITKNKSEIKYEAAVNDFIEQCANENEIDIYFENAVNEIRKLFNGKLPASYYRGILCRIVLSALIDADRIDTAGFMTNGKNCAAYTPYIPDWNVQLDYMHGKSEQLDKTGAINAVRAQISDICAKFAANKSGIYRLNVPTGGGKTLSSLRYALSHAAKYKKERIFFVIPLLSVIEQNSEVIKSYIENKDIVLEHHSNIIFESEQTDELHEYEILTENWNSPVVVTTLVQLLYTLFLGRTTSIRRTHALCNSIIIIDEVQSLPYKLISMMNMALNYLTKYCNSTIILCSATQPCYENVTHKLKYGMHKDIISDSSGTIFNAFKRTQIKNLCRKYKYTTDELSELILQEADKSRSILTICNTRKSALSLYKALDIPDKNYHLFHLSNSMCMQNRTDKLNEIRERLSKGEHVICISTQLIEAGVDISFETVVRCLAGIDSIAQAAGRCNRNNEYGHICNVYIVNPRDENTAFLPDIEISQKAAEELLFDYDRNPDKYKNDLLSDTAVKYYYRRLFHKIKKALGENYFDCPANKFHTCIYDMLSKNELFNEQYRGNHKYILNQAFETAGREFNVFEENTVDIIVPYKDGKHIIADLCSKRAGNDIEYVRAKLKEAKAYTVSVFENQYRALTGRGACVSINSGINNNPASGETYAIGLIDSFYSEEIGIDENGGNDTFTDI